MEASMSRTIPSLCCRIDLQISNFVYHTAFRQAKRWLNVGELKGYLRVYVVPVEARAQRGEIFVLNSVGRTTPPSLPIPLHVARTDC